MTIDVFDGFRDNASYGPTKSSAKNGVDEHVRSSDLRPNCFPRRLIGDGRHVAADFAPPVQIGGSIPAQLFGLANEIGLRLRCAQLPCGDKAISSIVPLPAEHVDSRVPPEPIIRNLQNCL